MGDVVGYARISTGEPDPAAQRAELHAAGAVRVFVDHGASTRVEERPQWSACLDHLRPGDTLVVRGLDRIASSETMAIETINDLHERGANIRSLTEPDIDTTTPSGQALFGIVAAFAQLRTDARRDSTRRGLDHARAHGRVGGRPTVMTPERVAAARRMREQGHSTARIARVLGVGASSVARALSKAQDATDAGRAARERVFFRDVKPYEAPTSLDELEGPDGGVIELAHEVLWAPGGGHVDLDEPGGTALAYQALLAEGSMADQVRGLNRDRLVRVWGELMLPARVRALWEERFPELAATVTV